MGEMQLVKTAIREGVWRAELHGADRPPNVVISHLDTPLAGVEVGDAGDGVFTLRVPIPAELLSDGVQSFVVTDADSQARLGHFTIITGQPATDDLRAEIDLLRAELDMLKSAFRRHCRETG